MRLQLHLTRTDKNDLLPLNYQAEIGSWIAGILASGQRLMGSSFTPTEAAFAYSSLRLCHFDLVHEQGALRLSREGITFEITFSSRRVADAFCRGLNQNPWLTLQNAWGRIEFYVHNLEVITAPVFLNRMYYRCISPMHLSVSEMSAKSGRRQVYLSPADPRFAPVLASQLAQRAGLPADTRIRFGLLTAPQSRLITLNAGAACQTNVQGHIFDFWLEAPLAIHRQAYISGFGQSQHTGFGCVKVLAPDEWKVMQGKWENEPYAPGCHPLT